MTKHDLITRRELLQRLALLTGATLAPWRAIGAVEPAPSDKLGPVLPQRTLGKTGLKVTMLTAGGSHIGRPSESVAQAVIEAAIESGIRTFDTAQLYQNGGSEERYGKFLTPKYREQVLIFTKTMAEDADTARSHLEGSLRRMKTDYLDLWALHDVRDIARVKDAHELGRLLELLSLRTAELLNVTVLSNELDLRRETVDQYLAILERLFLIRRLSPWHRHESKRLIKTPKIHLLDSGLAATLAGLASTDWLHRRDRFGHLLESFVVEQLIAQAGWTDPDLRFWHYRDKDQVEVDLVITRGRETWGVEVKTSATVTPSDGNGLRRLADQCGKDFQGGVLFYSGANTLPMADPRFLAVPLAELWDM